MNLLCTKFQLSIPYRFRKIALDGRTEGLTHTKWRLYSCTSATKNYRHHIMASVMTCDCLSEEQEVQFDLMKRLNAFVTNIIKEHCMHACKCVLQCANVNSGVIIVLLLTITINSCIFYKILDIYFFTMIWTIIIMKQSINLRSNYFVQHYYYYGSKEVFKYKLL